MTLAEGGSYFMATKQRNLKVRARPRCLTAPLTGDEVRADEAAKLLGVPRRMVYRLYNAGYLRGRKPAPNTLYLARLSVLAHREATRNPEYWERHERP